MTTKPPILRFREKNPNRIPVQLFSGDDPIIPTEELALFLEIRADQAGRLVASLPLTQLTLESTTLVTPIFDLEVGIYYVGLRQEPAGGPPVYRSGVCFLQILPIGSLSKISDGVGLSITLDESTQVLNVVLDATPFSELAQQVVATKAQIDTLAETMAEQVEQVANTIGNMLLYGGLDEDGAIILVAGENISITTTIEDGLEEYTIIIPD